MVFTLKKIDYAFDALEPYIDAKTMEIHHTKHHQTYVDKLNVALQGHEELQSKTIYELLKNLNSISESVRTAVRNHGGGVVNHDLFFDLLKKDVKIKGEILKEIEKSFGSFDNFKAQFVDAATKVFGSGWTWLVLSGNKLEIINTANQDSPISLGKVPLLALDIWEHAYYLKYQNRRPEYIEAFFHVINWDKINKLFLEAKK